MAVRFSVVAVAVLSMACWAHAQYGTAQPVPGWGAPTPAYPPYPTGGPPPAYGVPGAYGAPAVPGAYGAPPAAVYGAPTYAVPGATVGPPPVFDPYAPGSVAPQPSVVPYTQSPNLADPWQSFNQPPPAGVYPQQPGAIYPEGMPYQWQPGGYTYQSQPGYTTQVTRFLQEIGFEYTWLMGDSQDPSEFDINRAEIFSTFAIPMFYNTETPLLVTPGFAVNWLAGPQNPADLPPRIYDAYLDFAWYPRVSQWLGGELGFRTGVWTDFDHVDSDAVRFLGRALASVSLSPTFDVLFGVVYLDRLDVKLLPAGGVYWRPTPDWDLYLVFPNPKARRRFTTVGTANWYWYMAGEYGGGSWAVNRSVGDDRIDINDIRAILGVEWEMPSQIRGHIEIGYVFDREVLFLSGTPAVYKPDDTIMLRGGVDF